MASNPVPRKWTVDEYLAYEEESGIKHEYIDGEIYAMSGGTVNHSRIIMSVSGLLFQQLRGTNCSPFPSDMRIKLNDSKYVYPDLSVVCGKPVTTDEKRTMLTNPILVVEVTSPSSKKYDMNAKAEMYFSLSTLKAYLVIEQNRAFAQLYTFKDDEWILKKFDHIEDTINLPMINAALSLSEIYENITFE